MNNLFLLSEHLPFIEPFTLSTDLARLNCHVQLKTLNQKDIYFIFIFVILIKNTWLKKVKNSSGKGIV